LTVPTLSDSVASLARPGMVFVSAGGGRRPPRRELVWVFRGVRRVRSGRGSARRGQKGVDFHFSVIYIAGELKIPKGRY
jgi:hypothetical protein